MKNWGTYVYKTPAFFHCLDTALSLGGGPCATSSESVMLASAPRKATGARQEKKSYSEQGFQKMSQNQCKQSNTKLMTSNRGVIEP